jgi:hypothetical protein
MSLPRIDAFLLLRASRHTKSSPMKTSLLVSALLQIFVTNFASAALIGKLQANRDGAYILVTEKGSTPLQLPAQIAKQTQSLIGKVPYVEITDGVLENGVIKSSLVPTIVSGNLILEGRLETVRGGNQDVYEISGTPVQFGRTKKLNGTGFDEKSRRYFSGREVRAVGKIENGIFTIQSILRSDVFSASSKEFADSVVPLSLMKSFNGSALNTAIKMVQGKASSPSPLWFRRTLFATPHKPVLPGAAVLMITASGSQVDDKGALNGHFAVGLGTVQDDLQIQGEMFNVYVTNEKEIVPGNINMNDYYGHLVSGQQNYRPTYTLLVYGISKEQILKVKTQLDRFHPLFRDGSTKITAIANCATLSVQAMADINFYGEQRNDGDFLKLSEQETVIPTQSKAAQLQFVLKTKRAEFMPGPAMTAILKNLKYLNDHEHLGITRADFVFGGQTPSARLVGTAPTTGIGNQFRRQVIN